MSILTAEAPKNENATPEAEVPQEDTEAKETGSISETNGEDSAAKNDSQLDENGSESTFSYERLKAKSTNPATGIDYMRREVCTSFGIINMHIMLHSISGLRNGSL